jgi:hypothetical protein
VSRSARFGARFLGDFDSVLSDDDCLEAMQGGKVRGRYSSHYSWLPLGGAIVTRTRLINIHRLACAYLLNNFQNRPNCNIGFSAWIFGNGFANYFVESALHF